MMVQNTFGSKKLLQYNFALRVKRYIFKQQLKYEIKEQIKKIVTTYELGNTIRIDGHQHTQMISVVLEAIQEVVMEEGYRVEYLRDSHDLFLPYLKQVNLLHTYRPINMIKVLLLNYFSIINRKTFNQYQDTKMNLSGVFMSGRMDYERLKRILPTYISNCNRKGKTLEILFHPGTLLERECGDEFTSEDALKFYLSTNRQLGLQSSEIVNEFLRRNYSDKTK